MNNIFEVNVIYIQQITYVKTYEVEARTADEARNKVDEIMEADDYMEYGPDEEGFEEVNLKTLGPDIDSVRLDGVVQTDAEVE